MSIVRDIEQRMTEAASRMADNIAEDMYAVEGISIPYSYPTWAKNTIKRLFSIGVPPRRISEILDEMEKTGQYETREYKMNEGLSIFVP